MLTRLRGRVSSLVSRIASPLAALPADFYTVLGLAAVAPYLYACSRGSPGLAAVLLLVSAGLDALDGAVARLRGEAGPRGAYLDSLLDRVADAAYAAGLFMLGYGVWLAYLFAVGSLLVSYSRARYESLARGSMEGVGLVERGDRVLVLAAVLLLAAAGAWAASKLLLATLTAAAWATFLQRLAWGYRRLPRSR